MNNKIKDRQKISKPVSHPVSNSGLSGLSNHEAAYNKERITLPLPPEAGEETRFEMEIYAQFMRHLRKVPNSRMEIKILSSIQFTADMMEISDALVAKILVDFGLKAPRKAFPLSFLDFADKSFQRMGWDVSAPPASVIKLHDHWNKIGEDRFARTMPGHFTVYNENSYITA